MATKATKILIAIVLTDQGVSSVRLGSVDDEGMKESYELLAKLSAQIRSLDAAVKIAAL